MTLFIQRKITIRTSGRGTYDVTGSIQQVVSQARIDLGICNVFLRHTSASLILCENADPDVRHDLESFMARLVPDGDPMFRHDAEGQDDMPAHIRSILTHASVSIPICEQGLALGTWQGIYLWEHRTAPHQRQILVTLWGESGPYDRQG